eukprot:Lankesteria_metandrocarpae@DN4614_c0_g2_i2.p1
MMQQDLLGGMPKEVSVGGVPWKRVWKSKITDALRPLSITSEKIGVSDVVSKTLAEYARPLQFIGNSPGLEVAVAVRDAPVDPAVPPCKRMRSMKPSLQYCQEFLNDELPLRTSETCEGRLSNSQFSKFPELLVLENHSASMHHCCDWVRIFQSVFVCCSVA